MKTKHSMILTVASVAMSLLYGSAAMAQEATPAPVSAKDADWAEYKAVTTCAWCHGQRGNSVSPIYPALAGQKAWYIVEQLQAFRAQTRRDPYARGMMWGMAAQLDDAQIAALADYFSKQAPFASGPSPLLNHDAEISQGKSIYHDGVPATGVPPCAACHQAAAEGSDQFPRLAGQHALYTIKQLIALHNGTREQVVMNGVAAPLKESDMKAVAYYLESLR